MVKEGEGEGACAWGQYGRTWSSTAREQGRTGEARADMAQGTVTSIETGQGWGSGSGPVRGWPYTPLGAHIQHWKRKDPQKTVVYSSAVEEN